MEREREPKDTPEANRTRVRIRESESSSKENGGVSIEQRSVALSAESRCKVSRPGSLICREERRTARVRPLVESDGEHLMAS